LSKHHSFGKFGGINSLVHTADGRHVSLETVQVAMEHCILG
jgi:hypothetical protein